MFKSSLSRLFLESNIEKILSENTMQDALCLNLGCGVHGRYSELLNKYNVIGVDVEKAEEKQPWEYHQCDAKLLPFESSRFDIVVAIESFEHIEENKMAMKEVARTLKPGGLLLVTTPTIWTWLFEMGRHGPHYYSKSKLAQLVQDSGIEVKDIKSCGGLLFYMSNLIKSWISPFGTRLFKNKWWNIIDTSLSPLYFLSILVDKVLPFPPTNWVLHAKKPN
ncbi:MAG: class I SAM-dependent methyltransferase [Gammaproteobacteria bacterium]|nr:class I SAM-dependent methyltransferase [Gammaproteobacteria bacterium]